MKEYTILALGAALAAWAMDRIFRVNILKRGEYYVFLCAIFLFKLLVNGYLTGQNIVIYSRRFYLGIRLGSIPLEDFAFGFSMVTMTIVFWEYLKKREGV